MSIETWKKEFYPISAARAAKKSKLFALEHCLKKWQGLTTANLKKHSLEPPSRMDKHWPDGYSCALCCKHPYCSYACPLAEIGCDCNDPDSPYREYLATTNPASMINALKKAVKKEKELRGKGAK